MLRLIARAFVQSLTKLVLRKLQLITFLSHTPRRPKASTLPCSSPTR
jgi:hypothetical protein